MPMPVDSDSPSFPDSPDDAQIMAYLLHRDSPDERAAFEKQLQQSDLLKVRVYELASLLQRLHSIPDAEPPGDLADRILRAVGTSPSKTRTDNISRMRVRHVLLRIAAAVILLLGSAIVIVNTSETASRMRHSSRSHKFLPVHNALSQALRWLASAQQPSGMWDAEKWGGDRRHNTGLTGLALMALLSADGHETEDYTDHIHRAMRFLLSIQKENGFFGPDRRSCAIDHCITTCALLEAYHRNPSRDLAAAIKRALRWVSTLAGFSCCAYADPDSRRGDPLSFWTQLAMTLAEREGFVTASERSALRGYGQNTLCQRMQRSAGSLTSVQILIRLAASCGPDVCAPDTTYLCVSRAVKHILRKQNQSGSLAGSWDDLDGYGRIGGRVYSTALAVLALQGYLAG